MGLDLKVQILLFLLILIPSNAKATFIQSTVT